MVSSRCFVVELLTLCEEAHGFIPVFCSGAAYSLRGSTWFHPGVL